MSKYIDIENFCENFCHCNNEYCDKPSCPILNAPTADVAEVKHGKWIVDSAHGAIACSACGCINLGYNGRPKPNYCPNCGARMDGGEE